VLLASRRGWRETWPAFDRGKHDWALEASTAYSKRHMYPGVADQVKEASERGQDIKAIYLVRDPVERIESHVTYLWSTPDGPCPSDSRQVTLHTVLTSMYASQS
jgi:hypothetical protein